MSIGERTPRSAANGNAHFAVAWTREIARTCEPCKQNAQIVGDDFPIFFHGCNLPHAPRRSALACVSSSRRCARYVRESRRTLKLFR